ncbi:MAG: hypothetical protein DMG05_15260 [Acidobacteria bacterium]|nr:MAG: hypothetical protein DMG05_15260 [Acidobacteriota bacterium]
MARERSVRFSLAPCFSAGAFVVMFFPSSARRAHQPMGTAGPDQEIVGETADPALKHGAKENEHPESVEAITY